MRCDRGNLSGVSAGIGAEDGVGDAADTPGFDNYYGWGRLNAYHTLLLAQLAVDSFAAAGSAEAAAAAGATCGAFCPRSRAISCAPGTTVMTVGLIPA